MSKKATVSVRLGGVHVRFVTPKQRGRVVACKVLRVPRNGYTREARMNAQGSIDVYYRKLGKDETARA